MQLARERLLLAHRHERSMPAPGSNLQALLPASNDPVNAPPTIKEDL
jgi:hypothetical protein